MKKESQEYFCSNCRKPKQFHSVDQANNCKLALRLKA
jgi:hypothetical protein